MGKWARRMGVILLVALLAIGGLLANAIWFKPLSIRVFYERVFLEFALENPEMLSTLRILEQVGITSHNDDLADISPEQTRKLNEKLTRDLETLRSYDRASLEGQTALSYDILEWFLDQQVRKIPFTWHSFPVNQMSGEQNNLPNFMATVHHIGTEKDARDYIVRLSKFPVKFKQLLKDLKLRESRGMRPPRFTVDKVSSEMRGFRSKPAQENVLYTSFEDRLGKVEGLAADTKKALLADVEKQINEAVYPAFDRLIAHFDALEEIVTANQGAWSLPDGDAYYALELRGHTTTAMTPEQIHQTGLAEVERIQAEMDAILKGEGYPDGTVAERMVALAKEERFLYPNTDEGREQILKDFQKIIDEIDAETHKLFGTLPKAKVEVKRVPPFRQEGSAGAYYQPPSVDGARPGVFYANLRDLNEHPKFGMRTLAYHEAVPGHHFHLARQFELQGLPQFRRFLPFTAFTEGWALYAEKLAAEAGFQKDPYDNLGRLQAELFRAVRLVVDTGIHKKRWSREQAIEYMVANTGMVETDVVTEVERYFVFPGQATAYKVGMLKILALRERAQETLGKAFDLRAFHDVLLDNGSLPLTLLEREVDAYIASKKGDETEPPPQASVSPAST